MKKKRTLFLISYLLLALLFVFDLVMMFSMETQERVLRMN